MSKLRHWKQRWSPTADLIFLKKLKLGDGFVLPGDPVTPEIREKLGLHRLRRWWDAGVLALAEAQAPNHVEKTYPFVEKGKAGWYTVTLAEGESPCRIRGKDAVQELLASVKPDPLAVDSVKLRKELTDRTAS